jgi:carboxypeptidase T
MKKTNKKNLAFVITIFISFLIFPLNSLAYGMDDIYNRENNFSNSAYQYYTYYSMTDFLAELEENNSEIMSVKTLGTTYEGRDIWMVKLSDNVELDENEPGVLFIGALHGNEWPSFEVLIYFINHMVDFYYKENTDDDEDGKINEDIIDGFDNDEDGLIDEDPSEDRVREAIDNTQIFLVPMVSPDGVEYGDFGSRKNRVPNHGPFGFKDQVTSYGVNLNRNFGYDWILYYLFPFHFHLFINGVDTSFNYRGPRPFSENETRAVKQVVENQNISIALSFHSYSEIMFFPWYHTSKKAPHEDIFLSIGENMSKINKYRLLTGGNYIIPRLGGTLGTFENWAYGEHNIIAFTMELCKIRIPTNPVIVLDACIKHVGVNLYLCERAQSLNVTKNKVSLFNTLIFNS